MQEGIILVTKSTQNKTLSKNQKLCKKGEITSFVNSKCRIHNIFDLEKVNFFDMGEALKELKPLPSTGAEILSIIRENDMRGLSGSAFPAAEKIEAVAKSNFGRKYFVINGVECDPGLMHDEWLLKNKKELVELGITAVKKTCNFYRSVLVTRLAEDVKNAETISVDYGYPLGEERTLIKTALGITIPKEESPAENGILVLNLQTVLSIGLAASGQKVDSRYLTVANLEDGVAKVVRAPFGISTKEILTKVFGEKTELNAYAGGGVMNAYPIEELPKLGYETCFIAYARPIRMQDPSLCDTCGDCEDLCPKDIPVMGIIRAWELSGKTKHISRARLKIYDSMDIYDELNKCLHCRACTYLCPKGIDPLKLLFKD